MIARIVAVGLPSRGGLIQRILAFITSRMRGPGISKMSMPFTLSVNPASMVPSTAPSPIAQRSISGVQPVMSSGLPCTTLVSQSSAGTGSLAFLLPAEMQCEQPAEAIDAEPRTAERDRHREVDFQRDEHGRGGAAGVVQDR